MPSPFIHTQIFTTLCGELVVEGSIIVVRIIKIIYRGFDKKVKAVTNDKISTSICVRIYIVYDYLYRKDENDRYVRMGFDGD